MNHLYVHYKNKYPLARVEARESSLDVYSQDGEHLVAVRKNGAGQWADHSELLGCRDRHDMAPIPKDSRLYKHCPKSGAVIKDEKFSERKGLVEKFVDGERVCSCDELRAKGFDFDDKQRVVREPKSANVEKKELAESQDSQ